MSGVISITKTMANCLSYNCDPLIDHTINALCGEPILGGAKNLVFLDCDHLLTDPSSGTQINAEVAAGRAVLVKNVSLDIPRASATKIESPVACSPDVVVTYERSFNLVDGNVNDDNIDFYNTLFGGRSIGGLIIQECGANQVTWIDSEVVLEGDRVLPKSNKEFQRFEATGTWLNKNMPHIYASPVGVF